MRLLPILLCSFSLSLLACDGGAPAETAPAASTAAKPSPEAPAEAPAEPASTTEAAPAEDPPPSEASAPAVDWNAPVEGCLRPVAKLSDLRCTLDSECVVVAGPCSNCWGVVNTTSQSEIEAELQARDANKKCAKPRRPPMPEPMCKAGMCAPLEPGAVVGCCGTCDDSGCDDCKPVAPADACEGVRTNCTKLASPRGDVLACSSPSEDAWGGLGDGKDLGVGGLGLDTGSEEPASEGSVEGLALSHGPASVQGELDKAKLAPVFNAKRSEIDACYAKAKAGKREGKITLNFVVTGEGKVGSSVVKASTVKDGNVGKCLAKAVFKWTFPRVEGGGVAIVEYDLESSST